VAEAIEEIPQPLNRVPEGGSSRLVLAKVRDADECFLRGVHVKEVKLPQQLRDDDAFAIPVIPRTDYSLSRKGLSLESESASARIDTGSTST
jgi:hypothetical protein